jgi:hypothetical protein
MPTSADLLPIYQRIAALEPAGLTPTAAALVPGAVFTAFATFPTAADIANGIPYPYSCHGCDTSTFMQPAIGGEDMQTHTVWSGVMFGELGDPLDALSARDAVWRNAYRVFHLLHLKLTDKNISFKEGMRMRAEPLSFDLENIPQIGVKFSYDIMTRVLLPTGF